MTANASYVSTISSFWHAKVVSCDLGPAWPSLAQLGPAWPSLAQLGAWRLSRSGLRCRCTGNACLCRVMMIGSRHLLKRRAGTQWTQQNTSDTGRRLWLRYKSVYFGSVAVWPLKSEVTRLSRYWTTKLTAVSSQTVRRLCRFQFFGLRERKCKAFNTFNADEQWWK